MSVIHKLIAVAMFAFPQFAHRHHALSHYHDIRAVSAETAFKLFNKQLINFGLNSTGKPILKNDDDKKILSLYHGKIEKKYLEIMKSEDVYPDPIILKGSEAAQGICQGISLDYLLRYLHKKQEGTETLSAIKQVSQLFCEQGTEEGQILQILSGSIENDSEIYKKSIQKQIKKVNEALDKHHEDLLAKIHNGVTKKEYDEILQEIQNPNYIKNKLKSKINQIKTSKIRILMPEMDFSFIDKFSDKSQPNIQNEWLKFLKNLPLGAHYITLNYGNKNGHAMAYIKDTESVSYLHDPNYGTVELSSESDLHQMWKLISEKYHAKEYCELDFYQCTLNAQSI